LETTAKFYLERLRSELEQARRRQYPDAAHMPAKWLALIAGRLMSVETLLQSKKPANRDLLAQSLLTELNDCYRALQLLHAADSTQVAYFVVRGLRRWFVRTDKQNEYLFTSGTNFETELLQSDRPVEYFHDAHAKAINDLPEVIYRVTMPGGALGAALHIPLVAHEVGHILFQRVDGDPELDKLNALGDGLPAAVRDSWMYWVGEVFSDTVCGFVAGPAGFFALHEKLRGADLPNSRYPHNAARVASLKQFTMDRFGSEFASVGVPADGWTDWPTRNDDELKSNCAEHGKYASMSRRLLKSLTDIRTAAVSLARRDIRDLEYAPKRLKQDLDDFALAFLHGIPPYETKGDLLERRPTDLATILNVGWYVAAFRLKDLFEMDGRQGTEEKPGAEGRKLARLDQLIMKAIELSETKREWAAA
jgi:hypothetical protein